MLVKGIDACDVFSFPRLHADLNPDVTIVTGPNGVGKSNLGRCLDLVSAVIEFYAQPNPGAARMDLYKEAGYWGAEHFRVAIEVELDQPWERELVLSFVRAAFAYGTQPDGTQGATPESLDAIVRALLDEESIAPLYRGTLIVCFDGKLPRQWFAAWQFDVEDQVFHIVLAGTASGQLRRGAADPSSAQPNSVLSFTQALYNTVREGVPLTALSSPASAAHSVKMDFRRAVLAEGSYISFEVPTASNTSLPRAASRRDLALGLAMTDMDNHIYYFTQVIWQIVRRGIVLTDNRRLSARRDFALTELGAPVDLRDGDGVAAELFRLRFGPTVEQERYKRAERIFTQLTGCHLSLRATPLFDVPGADWRIEPMIVSKRGEIPLALSGAGREEALVLAVLLSGEHGRLLALDEPAVNLEPTAQRRLIGALRGAGQVLVITHNPDMVPVDDVDDLRRVVRLAPIVAGDGVEVHRAPALPSAEQVAWRKLLEPTHVRALLFAAKVILCEGSTEIGALPVWWRDTSSLGLPDPEAAHIPIVSVGGDRGFTAYVRYLDAFGIPWAAVADGPALRSSSNLAKYLVQCRPALPTPPPDDDDFEAWRGYWQAAGVFTLADQFGDDGTKAGEFEAFLDRVDPEAHARAKDAAGTKSKPRIGACFAIEHPSPPPQVLDLYGKIMQHFGYTGLTNP